MNHEDPYLHLQADDDLYEEHSPSCRCSLCHPEEVGPIAYPTAVTQRLVWLLIERHEDEGTDWYQVRSTHMSKAGAEMEENILEAQHGNEDGDWCECHRLDWRVEGPFTLEP